MEPYVTRQSSSNPFNISPLLLKFENQLRREIVLLTIRLSPARSPILPTPKESERRHDAQRLQQAWERRKRDILDAQHGDAFTYRLRNLEHIEQVVLFSDQCTGPGTGPRIQRSSFDTGRSASPPVDVASSPSETPGDADLDEAFKTPPLSYYSSPLSPQSPYSPSSPSSPQSPRSSQWPASRSWAEFSGSGPVRQIASSSSSRGGLLRRTKSQENSPRARVEAIGFKERVKVFKKRYPRRERTIDDLRDITSSSSSPQQWWEAVSGTPSHADFDQEVDMTDLEGVHESLDRMSRIMSEMALLINMSTTQLPPTGRHGRRRSSSSAVRRRMSRARRASRYHSGAHSPAASEGSGIPLGEADASTSRSTDSHNRSSPRDLALFPTSDESQASRRRGSHLRPQRRQELCSASALKTAAQVAKRDSDQALDLSWGFSDSQSSHSKKLDEPRRPLSSQSGLELSNLQGPESDTADERVASAASAERFPGPFLVRQASIVACSGGLSVDSSALFEAALPYDSNDVGRLSPGEVMLSTYKDGADSPPEPVFLSLRPEERRRRFRGSARSVRCIDAGPGEIMLASHTEGAASIPEASFPSLRPEDRERGFRGIARSVSWTDAERCHTEFDAADEMNDDVPCSSSDDGLLLGGMPIYQGAKEDAYQSQHIWRYANSETGRVIDEAAMRRLEIYKTTLVDNIDGQPPHMKAAFLRLASDPVRVPGQRMCQLQIVCIITPVAQESGSAPTGSEHVAAAADQPSTSNPLQMRP